MTVPIPCDELLEALDDYALDRLPPERRDAVLHHVTLCPECAQEVARHNDLWARLALVAEPEAVNAVRCAGIRSRLMARAMADRETGGGGAGVVPITSARSAAPAPAPAPAPAEANSRTDGHGSDDRGAERPRTGLQRGLVIAMIVAFLAGIVVGELLLR